MRKSIVLFCLLAILSFMAVGCRPSAKCAVKCMHGAVRPMPGCGDMCADSSAFAAYLSGFHEIKNWRYVSDDSLFLLCHMPNKEKKAYKPVIKVLGKKYMAYCDTRGNGNVRNTHREIPACYGPRFLWRGFDDEPALCYRYGGKVRLDNGDWVCFVYREDSSCILPFGKGVNEVFLLAYSPIGRIKARHLVAVERNMAPSRIAFYTEDVYPDRYFGQKGKDTVAIDSMYYDRVGDSVVRNGGPWEETRVSVSEFHATYAQKADSVRKYGVHYKLQLRDDDGLVMKRNDVNHLSHKGRHLTKVYHDNRHLIGGSVGTFDMAELDDAYHSLRSNPGDSAVLMRFFNAFPSNPTDLSEAYRFRLDKHFDMHVYLEGFDQVMEFVQLFGTVPDDLFLHKFVGLWKCTSDSMQSSSVYTYVANWVLRKEIVPKKFPALLRVLQSLPFKDQFEFWQAMISDGGDDAFYEDIRAARKKYGAAYPVVFMVIDDAMKYYCNEKFVSWPRDQF